MEYEDVKNNRYKEKIYKKNKKRDILEVIGTYQDIKNVLKELEKLGLELASHFRYGISVSPYPERYGENVRSLVVFYEVDPEYRGKVEKFIESINDRGLFVGEQDPF